MFEKLKQITETSNDEASKTKEYVLDRITLNGKSPVLSVLSTTNLNRPYMNAVLKDQKGSRQRKAQAGKIDMQMAEELREKDRERFSRHVVKGWNDLINDDGVEPEFTRENCAEFLNALPDDIFDDLRIFCDNINNFVEDIEIDIEETAKNLQSGLPGN